MNEFLVCNECSKGEMTLFQEENKEEEYICVFCNHGEAEYLIDGQPGCIECKHNKKNKHRSSASSLRSEKDIIQTSPTKLTAVHEKSGVPNNIAEQLKLCMEICNHRPGDSTVSVEMYKAHKFLQKYISKSQNELIALYNTKNDGFSAMAFHSRCDDCKNGLIIILSLNLGYEIAAFTWKGIRKNISKTNDSQMGGAFINSNSFELVPFNDSTVFSLAEGIRFGADNSLYLNFDVKEKSLCNFDPRLKDNLLWTSYIVEITIYKLQIAE
ncbi:hypothetical protein SteCoe_8386 [Stentor coeruleus]|uniref:TLDc domain-containing protein n=1 Tax=Stentor coeruleus TaxID=5963 RepID=A0A1R2CKC7_9CILI|nr:hypothetical protein SteCoe_8386 [Stentor coeruleus]